MFRLASKLALFLLLLILFLRFLPPIPISSIVTQKQGLFTVTGVGKVTVVPDTAIVELGVLVNRPTVVAAQHQANTIINDISTGLKSQGMAAKDIKTSNYDIYPQYDYSSGSNRITGFQVSVNLTVTIRDIAKINSILDAATAKGANTVSGIQLTVDEDRQKKFLQEARELAVKEAKSKAESLARAAGLPLGRIVNVSESGAATPEPRLLTTEKALVADGGGDTQIQAGSADIVSTVTLSYETR